MATAPTLSLLKGTRTSAPAIALNVGLAAGRSCPGRTVCVLLKGKVFDTHAEVLNNNPRLVILVVWQLQYDKPARHAILLDRLGEQFADQLVRVAILRQLASTA